MPTNLCHNLQYSVLAYPSKPQNAKKLADREINKHGTSSECSNRHLILNLEKEKKKKHLASF